MVLPAFLVYAVFMLLPFLTSISYSLTDWNGASSEQHFVGLDNYAQLATDPQLIAAAVHNVIWVIAGTLPPILIGLLLALVIWGGVRAATFWRALFFIPFVLAPIVVGIAWSWIYNPLFGSLNKLLTAVGLGGLDPTAGSATRRRLVGAGRVGVGLLRLHHDPGHRGARER